MDYSLPVPIGGWNALDALDMMQPTDAIQLVNIIPRETSIEGRKGSTLIIDSFDLIDTLAIYNGATNQDLIACGYPTGSTTHTVYTIDVVNGTKTSIGTGTGSKYQTLNINDKLVMVNGIDTPRYWDGTTLTNLALTGTGLTDTTLNGVMMFKGRSYYWAEGTNSFWYAAAGAFNGALTEFAIDFVTQKGGGIKEIVTWTRDSGSGMDDLFIILMDTGETLVYQGDDPSATNWQLIGRFALGQPLSIRGSTQVASDRVIITKDGYINLTTALQQARLTKGGNVGEKIVNEVKRLTDLYSGNFGWEINFFPSQSLLLINVPIDIVTPNTTYEQHVMNTNTGSWCKFSGWNAKTFTEYNDDVYFGTSDGKIFKAFDGTSDDGQYINAEIIPAFNNFQQPANNKQLTMCTVLSNYYAPNYLIIDSFSNFNVNNKSTMRYRSESPGTYWDVSDWDVPFWSEGDGSVSDKITAYQIPVSSYGYSLTIGVRYATKLQSPKFYSFKLKFKQARSI